MRTIRIDSLCRILWRAKNTALSAPRDLPSTDLERLFLTQRCVRLSQQRRISSTLGLLIWSSFVFTDLMLMRLDPAMDKVGHIFVAARFAALAIAIIPWALSFRARAVHDEEHMVMLLLCGCVPLTAALLVMMVLAPSPYDMQYYLTGITMVMMYYFGMFRLRASHLSWMLGMTSGLTMIILWAAVIRPSDPIEHTRKLVNALTGTTLMVSINLIAYMVSILMENNERQAFMAEQALKETHADLTQRHNDVARLNQELSQLMAESMAQAKARLAAEERYSREMEQRNRDKSRFLALAVHDLKQPLQAMGNALFTAQHALVNEQKIELHQSVSLARTANDVMRKQLDAILDLSRLESGAMNANLTTVDIANCLHVLVTQQRSVAKSAGVNLTLDIDETQSWTTESDPVFLPRIVLNLVGNAIKYRTTGQGSAPFVRVSIRLLNTGWACIEVADNGVGIAEEHLRSGAIFEPFFQIDNMLPEAHKGVGLGLTLVRAMVNLLPGHKLTASSVQGEGSTFSLTLPLCSPKIQSRTSTELLHLEELPDLSGTYVILVEDDPLVLASTSALLKTQGCLVESLCNLAELKDMLTNIERTPELIISDYRLPDGRTALDVIDAIRSMFGRVPAVVISGELGKLPGLQGLIATQLLRKPLSPNVLLRIMAESLRPTPETRDPVDAIT